MIPTKIHYCWFGGGRRNRLMRRCLKSWPRVLPEYQIKEWNETNSPLAANSYVRAAYEQKLWSRLSNYVRLHALYTEGGIYFDTDVEVRKDFTPLLAQRCFLGFQQEEEQSDWIGSGVIGAEAGHPFLKRCMEQTVRLFETEGEFYRGPTIITAVLKEMGLGGYGLREIDGVTVYPAEYFYPYPWFGRFSPDCIKPDTYSIHHWAASWLSKEERRRLPSHSPITWRLRQALRRGVATRLRRGLG